ncbi:MAG: transposase [Weeksellaceae bacterium]
MLWKRRTIKRRFHGVLKFNKQRKEKGTLKDLYLTRRSDCKDCPLKTACIGKQHEKKIMITAYREYYERNNERLKKRPTHKTERMKTVEPVFGTLTNYLGMSKVNTRGIKQANKCMLMAGAVFNLKKLLKYGRKPLKSTAKAIQIEQKGQETLILILTSFFGVKSNILSHSNYFITSPI